MKYYYICTIETLSYIQITMENPYVGVAGNYSPHQSSQYFISSNLEQKTRFVCYQTCFSCSADGTLHGTINMNLYNTKHTHASTMNSFLCSKFCYYLFRCNSPSHNWLLSIVFFFPCTQSAE